MHADLGRQLGVGDERGQRLFGEPQALVEVGHRREHGGRVEIAERRRIIGWHGQASLRGG